MLPRLIFSRVKLLTVVVNLPLLFPFHLSYYLFFHMFYMLEGSNEFSKLNLKYFIPYLPPVRWNISAKYIQVTACGSESWHGQWEREWTDLCGPDPAVSAQTAFPMAWSAKRVVAIWLHAHMYFICFYLTEKKVFPLFFLNVSISVYSVLEKAHGKRLLHNYHILAKFS